MSRTDIKSAETTARADKHPEFTPPRIRKEGKLPVITAGSGDLGTPDP